MGLSLRENKPLPKAGRAELSNDPRIPRGSGDTRLTWTATIARETPIMYYKTLVAASLMSIALTSSAFAQCADCAQYPDRDYLNKGAQTPAGKMGLMRPGGAAGSANNTNSKNAAGSANATNSENSANNARAEVRDHQLRRSRRGNGVDGNPAK